MKNLSKEQWKRVFEVMLKESRQQKRIIKLKTEEFKDISGRIEALKMADEIRKIALINAGGIPK
tara:strand:+ start:6653 stop:6844 length:192 start_codon:yes stop_codon:yes gene_type:complete